MLGHRISSYKRKFWKRSVLNF